jgi:hypothetical protein
VDTSEKCPGRSVRAASEPSRRDRAPEDELADVDGTVVAHLGVDPVWPGHPEVADVDGTVVADLGVDPVWPGHPEHGRRRGYLTIYSAEPPQWPEGAVNVRVTSSLDPERVLGISLSAAQVDLVLEAL